MEVREEGNDSHCECGRSKAERHPEMMRNQKVFFIMIKDGRNPQNYLDQLQRHREIRYSRCYYSKYSKQYAMMNWLGRKRDLLWVCLEKAVDVGILVEKEHKWILEMMSY